MKHPATDYPTRSRQRLIPHAVRALISSSLFLGALSLSACKSAPDKQGQIDMNDFVTRTRPLMVARGTNGTTLAWESSPNERYSVKIRDGHYQNSPWVPHPKLQNIRGTGQRITYKDNPGPTEKRRYSLQVENLDGSSPKVQNNGGYSNTRAFSPLKNNRNGR